MKVFSKTDIGKRRSENQDRVWAALLDSGAAVVVLCDGMGGENAGSFASETTVNFISERVKRGFRPELNRNSIRNLLITSVTAANNLVYDIAEYDQNMLGMGTTCVGAIVFDKRAYIINVGDSRVYHVFGENIQQITKDHSYINKLIDDGEITEEEGKSHPKRNCLTRAVGAEPILTPDYYEIELQEDSILMLSSDGLHAYGEDMSIAEIIVNNPVGKICGKLVEYALETGGRDNITVAVISVK
ncbi:MAG: Stp1/IreP family PP2C-type Ser/Thr phosphatase [Oscillospiraceae bacterium]|jgi:protein phosphatase|nr:Stp1/IreP family PP2C-type Ser/Thr phosphatase [Oscillospiraceae bacterium]